MLAEEELVAQTESGMISMVVHDCPWSEKWRSVLELEMCAEGPKGVETDAGSLVSPRWLGEVELGIFWPIGVPSGAGRSLPESILGVCDLCGQKPPIFGILIRKEFEEIRGRALGELVGGSGYGSGCRTPF